MTDASWPCSMSPLSGPCRNSRRKLPTSPAISRRRRRPKAQAACSIPARSNICANRSARSTASRSRTRPGTNCGRWRETTSLPPNSVWRDRGDIKESNMTRQVALVGFLQAQNCTNLPSSWRHPESRDDSMSADYYQEIGRILESGKFHMAFFDDRLAMPDRYGSDHAHTVEYGIRCVKMDPIVVLTMMGAATEKLGLASTCSTTYYEPFDVARRFATLDLMTGGRAAWNVVTSVNDGEAHNMGKAAHLDHDFRYDRADEFMEVVLGHWDSWEDGSLLMEKKPEGLPIQPRSSALTTMGNSSNRADRSPCRARNRDILS